jgi:hypothetical protein
MVMFEELLSDRHVRYNVYYKSYGETLKQARSRAQAWDALLERDAAAMGMFDFDYPFPDDRY